MRGLLRAGGWIGLYVALVLAPLLLLFVGEVPGGLGFGWDFSIAVGFAALSLMGFQFLLSARFRRASAPFGIDVIYFFHRYAGVLALLLVLLHVAGLNQTYPSFASLFNPLAAPAHMTAGIAAAAALAGLVVSSLWRKRLRLPYDAWRLAHGILALAAVALALGHVHGVGYYAAGWRNLYWAATATLWAGTYFYVRGVKPWRLLRHPYRVIEVSPERGDCWTLVLAPVEHRGFAFQPGQFAWLTLRSSPFAMHEHPYSIASRPQPDGQLAFTIKELGDFTRTIGSVRPGELAYVDGPYGAFTIDRYADAPAYVFIGGGVGMAPLMSMLRALAERGDRRPLLLVSGSYSWERVTFREEVDALAAQLDLRIVRVLEAAPENWSGERGRIEPALLERHLAAQPAGAHCFVCGPQGMIDSVERSLYQLGIPLSHTHSELFDLA